MTCYNCGKQGHKVYQCPQKQTRFQGNCKHCGRQGHLVGNCWEKEESAPLPLPTCNVRSPDRMHIKGTVHGLVCRYYTQNTCHKGYLNCVGLL